MYHNVVSSVIDSVCCVFRPDCMLFRQIRPHTLQSPHQQTAIVSGWPALMWSRLKATFLNCSCPMLKSVLSTLNLWVITNTKTLHLKPIIVQ